MAVGKASPIARAVRTFAAAMAGILAAAAVADWTTDWKASGTALALGTIAAGIAGVVAYLQGVSGLSPTSTLGKALVTAAQTAAAGLATVGVADLTQVAFEDFGLAVVKVAVASVFAGLVTLSVNAAEGQPVPTS